MAAEMHAEDCSIARTLQVLGDRWTLLVLREAFLGVSRFDALQRNLGIARDVLTVRLGRLVDEGVLEKLPYQEPGQRRRYEYRLTERGFDAYPIIVALMAWGDRHRAEHGPPVELVHRGCGALVAPELRCEHGHRVAPAEVQTRRGPGSRRAA
jgi:DNA-binding HxlR family transcriptional regulator